MIDTIAAKKNANIIIIMVSGRLSANPIIRTTIPSPYPSDWFVIMLISKKHKPGKQLKSISIKDSEAVNGFTMAIIIKKHKANNTK